MGKPGRDPTSRPSATPASPCDYPISLDDQLCVEDRQLLPPRRGRPEASLVAAAPAGRLAGRLALITGASRGLGAALRWPTPARARIACWSPAPWAWLEALDDQIKVLGGAATLVRSTSPTGRAIDRLGAALYERYGRLDVLLGNAGILGTLSPVGHIEPTVFERVMAVNVTANWRLIRSLDPLLRQSDAGPRHFCTSGISRKVVPYGGPYAASKAALDMLVRHLCRRSRAQPPCA